MKQKKVEVIKFSVYCPVCNKEISGSKPSQVNYNLEVHIKQKHGEENEK